MVGEKDKGKGKLKEMEEEDKAAKGKKAEKRKKKSGLMSGEGSKKKVSSKKEIQKEKSSKEKKPAREKKGQKVVPGWGLTRGVHPPRFNNLLISCHFLVQEDYHPFFSLPGDQALSLVGDLPTHGHLAATSRGLLYLDLDDRWIFNLQQELARSDLDRGGHFGACSE